MENFLTFFKKYTGLNEFSEDDWKLLTNFVSVQRYKEGENVFSENDKGQYLYIVKSGTLEMKRGNVHITTFKEGDVFGEVALINENLRFGTVVCLESAILYQVKGEDILTANKIPPELALKLVRVLARQVTTYLRSPGHTKTEAMIKEGEGEHIEFKSSLRYNLHSKKFGKEIEHAALKTIAAFLNSEGGILLIGIDDHRGIIGIDHDNFENDDKALLHFTNLVKERIGMQFMTYIDCNIDVVEGKEIMRIDVSPSGIPAYLTYNQSEYFFIRTGPSTSDLKASEIYDYVHHRFYHKLN